MQRSGHFHLCTVAAVGVAYPTVFYAKGLHGRIDDPNADGKAVDFGSRAVAAYRGVRKAARARRPWWWCISSPDPLAH
jgi:hypothetical protein